MNESPTTPALDLDLDLDPAWRGGSLTECEACHQPIAIARGDASARCGHCGATSSLPTAVAPDDPAPEDDLQLFDLRRSPAGIENLGERPGAPRLPELRRAWEDTKSALAGPHSLADEFRAVWLAGTLGRIHGATGDPIRERAVLEAALARIVVPAYRALILARLTRAAAFAGHLALAEEWLSMAPEPSGIVEIDGDVTVARALVWLKRGRFAEVRALLGEDDEGGDFVGLARPFADLARIEALERSGRGYPAYVLYRKAIKAHGAIPLQGLVMYYRLGVKTRRWIVGTGFAVMAVIVALLAMAWKLATWRD
ncbi:MAG: hypothetical protein ABJE95_13910 [Byssovorax sp.]